jgi:hypothetical protein
MRKIRVGAGTDRYKIEQLQLLLQQKRKQLAKLERIRRVLTEREQVKTLCPSLSSVVCRGLLGQQQVDAAAGCLASAAGRL